MSDLDTATPVALPVLSRGKHRRPRKGACFMEFASFLAGERWSDHPECTHPLLASMARQVNDVVSDRYRPRLAELIPLVIGVNDDDPRLDAIIARRAAATALPVAAAWRQRVLCVAMLSSERILAELDGRSPGSRSELAEAAMAQVPDAAQWAGTFTLGNPTTPRGFRRHAAPTAVRCAVEGIAHACIPDPDRMLHQLLSRTIEDCRAWVQADAGDGTEADAGRRADADAGRRADADAGRWADACRLTGTRHA